MKTQSTAQLNPLAAALTVGLCFGLTLLVMTFAAVELQVGEGVLALIDWYPGYEVSKQGALLGLLWGFLDGFLGTYVMVWVYNFFVRKLSK